MRAQCLKYHLKTPIPWRFRLQSEQSPLMLRTQAVHRVHKKLLNIAYRVEIFPCKAWQEMQLQERVLVQ